jgi:succinate-acetate transporter protein
MWEFALAISLARLVRSLNFTFCIHIFRCNICGTAFTSYDAFWLPFATLLILLIPGSGVADAYKASSDPAKNIDAIAIYLSS